MTIRSSLRQAANNILSVLGPSKGKRSRDESVEEGEVGVEENKVEEHGAQDGAVGGEISSEGEEERKDEADVISAAPRSDHPTEDGYVSTYFE